MAIAPDSASYPILGAAHAMAFEPQQLGHEFPVVRVVLDHRDVELTERGRSR